MDAYLALGYKCNHSCKCCPLTTYDRLHAAFTKEELQNNIDNILIHKETDSHINITVSGGEPFLNENVFLVLSKLLADNVRVTVLTNATCLSLLDYQKQLKSLIKQHKNKYFRIVTAIHSSNNEKHDYLTGCEGSFWESIKGLEFASSLPISVTVKIIINKLNYTDLENTVAYIDEHFPMNVDIQFCGMDYSGRAEKNVDELFVSFEDIQPYFEKAIDYIVDLNSKREPQRKISVMELPLCLCDPYYWSGFLVPPKQSTFYLAPNADTKDRTVYADAQCGAFYDECKNCKVNHLCYGTWKSTYRIKKDLLRTIK